MDVIFYTNGKASCLYSLDLDAIEYNIKILQYKNTYFKNHVKTLTIWF